MQPLELIEYIENIFKNVPIIKLKKQPTVTFAFNYLGEEIPFAMDKSDFTKEIEISDETVAVYNANLIKDGMLTKLNYLYDENKKITNNIYGLSSTDENYSYIFDIYFGKLQTWFAKYKIAVTIIASYSSETGKITWAGCVLHNNISKFTSFYDSRILAIYNTIKLAFDQTIKYYGNI